MGALEPAVPPRIPALRLWLATLGVSLLAFVPSLGTFRAPWIAEDAAILAQVAEDGPWADWTRSQYGMLLLRFWRPLVSTSWALQESASGIDPLPLRLFNVSLHALAAGLVFACARRLGARTPAAALAGAWIAFFPEQGGTCTWLAGRTDLLCAVFLLASLHAALGASPLRAAPFAFLASASKEFGFLAPFWIAAFAFRRDVSGRALWRRAGPAGVAVGIAFVWRAFALDGIAGGYRAAWPGFAPGLVGCARALLVAAWPSLLALAGVLLAGLVTRSFDRRGVFLALVAGLSATVLLVPLLADGTLEPENRRLLYVPECALALAVGLAWSRWPPQSGMAFALGIVALLVLGQRGVLAWRDTRDWARSARMGEQEVRACRALLSRAEPSERPVLFDGFPVSASGAYCLGFGLAARFRAPFPVAPRPVWPWRLLFVPQAERVRAPLVTPRGDGSLWPLDDARTVPELVVLGEDELPPVRLELDERVLERPDRSPRLRILGGSAGAPLEVVWFTELGYEPVPLARLDGAGATEVSLVELLTGANGVASSAETLEQAADLGAKRAYLEFRALGTGASAEAASRWIELGWPPELLARALNAR